MTTILTLQSHVSQHFYAKLAKSILSESDAAIAVASVIGSLENGSENVILSVFINPLTSFKGPF